MNMAAKRNGKWFTDFRYKGERYRKISPINTKAAAEAYERKLMQNLIDYGCIEGKVVSLKPTFEEFSLRWLNDYVTVNCKPSTFKSRESIMRNHIIPYFGQMRLNQIKVQDLESYKAKMLESGQHPKSINNHLGVIGKCLRTATDWGIIESVPRTKKLQVPEPKAEFLSMDELHRLLSNEEEPVWNAMLVTAGYTGMRLGELIGLHWEDVVFSSNTGPYILIQRNMVRGVLGTPKSGKSRKVPMHRDVYNALWSMRKPNGLVFTHNGLPITYWAAESAIRRACNRANIRPIGWHKLRHTFASQMVMANVPLRTVQVFLGHSTINMTERYAHLAPSAVNEAMKVFEQKTASPQKDGHYMVIDAGEQNHSHTAKVAELG